MTETISKPINSKPENKRQKKVPKKITASYLHNSGLYYLERYSASASHFRQVMLRKAKRSCLHHTDQDYDECVILIDALVEKFIKSGLLNDEMYINGMVSSLRRRGLSARMISQKLMTKGIPAETSMAYLAEHDENAGQTDKAEYKAAAIFCRKKKLGCHAKDLSLAPEKQLAKLARAGFSFETAKKVLDMDEEALHELIYN